jgi:integrase
MIIINMDTKIKYKPNPELKLMDQVREVLRYNHYAYRTEQTYCQWIRKFIYFYGGKIHPNKMDHTHVERFLSHLATEENVATSTQRQAMNALVFLYENVLHQPFNNLAHIRSKRSPNPPTVLTKEEVQRLFMEMSGLYSLLAKLLYGSGLRLLEALRLRIQDIDFGQNLI